MATEYHIVNGGDVAVDQGVDTDISGWLQQWKADGVLFGGITKDGRIADLNGVSRSVPSTALTTGALAQSIDRSQAADNLTAMLSTGRITLVRVYLAAGQVVNSISFCSATTAGGTLTAQWFGLYSPALAKLAITADDTSTAWAANTRKTLAFATPYKALVSGDVYAAINVTATTVPTLLGKTGNTAATGATPVSSGYGDSSLTNAASAPDPCAALTALAGTPWVTLQ